MMSVKVMDQHLSKDAYNYWNKTTDERNTSKRVLDHLTREERVTDEIIKVTNKKQKVVKEEANKTSANTSASSPSSDVSQSYSKTLANIWSVWSEFLHLFLIKNEKDTDINNYR
jgi:protease II